MPKKPKPMEFNPLCLKFPPMPDDELAKLVKDIEENGLKEPIQLDAEGRILDGRNRYTACLAVRRPKPAKFMKWRGRGSPERYLAYVLSKNERRRHMTAAQRAQLIVSLNAEALIPPDMRGGAALLPGSLSKSQSTLADEADVGERTIRDAVAVHKKATPEQEQAVIDGKASPASILRPKSEPRRPSATQDMGLTEEMDDGGRKEDCFGNKLPKHVGADFDQADILLGWKQTIEKVRREIEQACQDGEKIATFVRLQGLQSDLNNATRAIRFALPYCLCPYCAGDAMKCKACEKAGWMPKDLYGQVVPRDMQWEKK